MDDRFYHEICGALRRSAQLEQRAATGDAYALRQKAAHDLGLLTQVKEAAWADIAPAVYKGLAGGTAAAVPLTAAGLYLSHKANNTAENVRNKALQAAAGVGTVGAGLLALHHTLSESRAHAKHASDYQATLIKLATVGYLDDVLADEEARVQGTPAFTDTHAIRLLNAEHGAALLHELLDD